MPSTHARFSPSAANRRLHCPPSLMLEEQFQDKESAYAAEGTAGHAMAEHLIKKYLKQRTRRPVSDYYSDELLEAVDEYVSFVQGEIEEARRVCKDPVFTVEQRVDASEYVEGCFGTADMVIVTDSYIHIIDQSEVYSGCYCNVSVTFYGYNSNGNRGIAAGLGNVQFVKDGEALGGRSKASDDFEAMADEDEDFLS